MAEIDQSAPILVFTGQAGNETAQFYVCCEQGVLLEAKTVKDAIIDLTAAYYVFDITYPRVLMAFYFFFNTSYLVLETNKLSHCKIVTR